MWTSFKLALRLSLYQYSLQFSLVPVFPQSQHHHLFFHHCFAHPSVLLLVNEKQRAVWNGSEWRCVTDCKSPSQSLSLQFLSPTLNLLCFNSRDAFKNKDEIRSCLCSITSIGFLLSTIIIIKLSYSTENSLPSSLSVWPIHPTHYLSLPANHSENQHFKCPWISCLAVLPHFLRMFWGHFFPAQTLFYWQISTHPFWPNSFISQLFLPLLSYRNAFFHPF